MNGIRAFLAIREFQLGKLLTSRSLYLYNVDFVFIFVVDIHVTAISIVLRLVFKELLLMNVLAVRDKCTTEIFLSNFQRFVFNLVIVRQQSLQFLAGFCIKLLFIILEALR